MAKKQNVSKLDKEPSNVVMRGIRGVDWVKSRSIGAV